MSNQKLNTERLIKSLKILKGVSCLHVYKGVDSNWINYFAISGILYEKYFSVIIMKNKEIEEIEICNTTDCKKEIEQILIKFNLV